MLKQINPQAQVYLLSPAKTQMQKPKSIHSHCALQDITNSHVSAANNNVNTQPLKMQEKQQPQMKVAVKSMIKSEVMAKSEKQSIQQKQQSEKQSLESEQENLLITNYTNDELQRMQEANWMMFDQLCYSKQFFDELFRNMISNFASKIAFVSQKSHQLITTNKESSPLATREFLSMETSGLFQQLMQCDGVWQHLYELMYGETRTFHQQCLIMNSMEEIYSIDPRNLCQFTNIIIEIKEEMKEESKQGNKIYIDFGKFLGYCEHLVTLQVVLRDMKLNDEQFIMMFSELKKLNFMESFALDVCRNQLTDLALERFSQELQELQQLTNVTLIFDFNEIASSGAMMLGDAIMKLQNVYSLNLQFGNNNIASKGAKRLLNGIKKLSQLVELKLGLRNNILSDKMFENFQYQMQSLAYLQRVEIDLYNNSISKVGLEALNQALMSGNYLFYLKMDIGKNEIDKIGSFLKFMKYGNKLLGLKLYLDTNALKSSQLKEIIKYLQYQTELTELKIDCSGYILTTAFFKEIGEVGDKMNKLEKFELSLNSCKITEEKVDLIINGMCKFKSLRMLALSLTDNGLKMTPENIKNSIKSGNEGIEMVECFI